MTADGRMNRTAGAESDDDRDDDDAQGCITIAIRFDKAGRKKA